MVQYAVQQVVAHICPRAVGQLRRHPGLPDGQDHVLHRYRGEIRRRSAGDDGRIYRLLPGVVRDPGVVHVDGHPLRGHGAAACRLAHAQHHIRPECVHSRRHHPGRLAEHRGHLQHADLRLRAPYPLHCLQGRIHGFPAEGGKARQKYPGFPNFLHEITPNCNLSTLLYNTYLHLARKTGLDNRRRPS